MTLSSPLNRWRTALVAAPALALAGCASLPPGHQADPRDPFEALNRGVFEFNLKADQHVIRPAAEAYRTLTPEPVRQGVGNVLGNLRDTTTTVHHVLQGELDSASESAGRVFLNSTVGLLGVVDVASGLGLRRSREDAGLTLANWGLPNGPFLMLPLMGPSTARDLVGDIVDRQIDPMDWALNADGAARNVMLGVSILDKRVSLMEAESTFGMMSFDQYLSVRDAYLARRAQRALQQRPSASSSDNGAGVNR
jgi:phospholipid-binding lipoprotein MlaA